MNSNVVKDKTISNPIRDSSQERKIVEIATNRILQSQSAIQSELAANNILKVNQLVAGVRTFSHNLSTGVGSQAMSLTSSRGATILQPSIQHTPRASTPSIGRIESLSSNSGGIQAVTVMQAAAITSVANQQNVTRGGAGAMLIYPSAGSLVQQMSSSSATPVPITLLSSNPNSYTLVRPALPAGGVPGLSLPGLVGGQAQSSIGAGLVGIQVPPACSNSTTVLNHPAHTLIRPQQLQITTIPAPARVSASIPARLSGVIRATELRPGISASLSNQPHIPRGPSAAATALAGPRIGAMALARHPLGVTSGVSAPSGVSYSLSTPSSVSKLIVPVRPSAAINQKFRAVDQALMAGNSSGSNSSAAAVQIAIPAGKLIGGDMSSFSVGQSRPAVLQQTQQIRALTSQQLAIHQGSTGAVPIRALLSPVMSSSSFVNPQISHMPSIASSTSNPSTLITTNRLENFTIPSATRSQSLTAIGSSSASMVHTLQPGGISLANSILLSASSIASIAQPTSAPASTLLQCANVTSTVFGQNQMQNSGPIKKYVNVPQPSVKTSNPATQFTISRLGKDATQAAPLNLSLASSAAAVRGAKPVRPQLIGQYSGQAILTAVTSKVGSQTVSLGSSSAIATCSVASSAMGTIPVAKVTPQGHTVLPSDMRPSLAVQKQQQLQQQRLAAAVSQAIQIPPGMFISGSYGSLDAGALSQSLSQVDCSRLAAVDSRQHGERFSVLHHLTLTDGNRMIASPHIMNLASPSNYTVPTVMMPTANLRPVSATSQTSMLGGATLTTMTVGSQGTSAPSVRQNPLLISMDGVGRQQTLSLQNFSTTALHDGRFSGNALNIGSSSIIPVGVSVGGVQGQPTVIASMQPPQLQHSQTSLENVNQQTMSPRPSILRKRHHESGTLPPRNLLSSLTTSAYSNPATVGMPETGVAASPKLLDGSRENSQSSTDTASSAESTPRSQLPPPVGGAPAGAPTVPPGLPPDKIRQPSGHASLEHDMPTNGQATDYKSVPRKKPRKQSLHANEEIRGGFSTDDDDDEGDGNDNNDDTLHRLSTEDSLADDTLCEEPDEFVDDEGVRWVREKKRSAVTIVGAYQCSWKPRNNHFLSYADIKHKEERKATINELANQKNIYQRISGWKLDHLAAQLQALVDLEGDVLERVKALQSEMSTKPVLRHSGADDEFRDIREVAQANIQRSQLYMDQMNEAKTSLLRLLDRKSLINDIINKHQSKRTVKKKER